MLKSVFIPNKVNSYAWVNLVFIIVLLLVGEIAAYTVLFGYFLETIVIGIVNIFKMYASRKGGQEKAVGFYISFFILHYGGFVAIQSIFLFAIFSISDEIIIKEPFNLIENFQTILLLGGMPIMLTVLIIGQFIKFYFDFIKTEKHLQFTAAEIMFKPYLRIFIQQFVVIIGTFFIILSGAPIFAAILLIILRFIVDFFLVSIRENSEILDKLVDKLYNGKVEKEEIRKQLLLFSE